MFGFIDKEEFDHARKLLAQVEEKLGADDPDVVEGLDEFRVGHRKR
jgi:hypothetical protein